MARAAKLSGTEDEVDDEDMEQVLEMEEITNPLEVKQMVCL